ncbi:MAG: metallophosphoesterase [Archangium sp.]
MPRIVAIADTHGEHAALTLPDGDILVHAGDLTPRGTLQQLASVADWLRAQPHEHKVVIAGNHDFSLQRDRERARALFHGLTYLEDEGATVAGLRVWGSPWQPWFHNWAFNARRGPDIDEKWQRIPEGIDVLVTHGPPHGYGDLVWNGERVGCEDLVRHLDRVKPKLHFFGHIHEDRGEWTRGPTRIVNCTTSECSLPASVVDV